MACLGNSLRLSQREMCEVFASLRAENDLLRQKVTEQDALLRVANARCETMRDEVKQHEKNMRLAQKVIAQEMDDAKRYRREIRRHRRESKHLAEELRVVLDAHETLKNKHRQNRERQRAFTTFK